MLFSINDPDPAKGYIGDIQGKPEKEFILNYMNSEVGSSVPPLNDLAIIIVLVPLFLLILLQNERTSLFLLHLTQALRFHVHLRG